MRTYLRAHTKYREPALKGEIPVIMHDFVSCERHRDSGGVAGLTAYGAVEKMSIVPASSPT